MKKIIVLMLTFLMLFALTACGNSGGDSNDTAAPEKEETTDSTQETDTGADKAKDSDEPYLLGIATPTSQEEIWNIHLENIKKYGEEAGFEVIAQSADGDAEKQVTQVEAMISQGINALVVAPVDVGTFGHVIRAAKDEGVYVVVIERLNPNDPYDAHVTYNNVVIGELIAQAAVDLDYRGNFVMLKGDSTTQPAADEIAEGMYNILQPYIDSGEITVVSEQNCKNWAADEALAHVENALTLTNDDVSAVLCANDTEASGAIQALKSANVTAFVGGQDAEVAAAARIVSGSQTMTVFKDPNDIAKTSVDILVSLLAGEEYEFDADYDGVPAALIPPVPVVGKEDVDRILIESGYMTEEEVYG